jgi:hypothetical protein
MGGETKRIGRHRKKRVHLVNDERIKKFMFQGKSQSLENSKANHQ